MDVADATLALATAYQRVVALGVLTPAETTLRNLY